MTGGARSSFLGFTAICLCLWGCLRDRTIGSFDDPSAGEGNPEPTVASSAPGCPVFVALDPTAAADGKSWPSAFPTLQAGIEAAALAGPCEVWVAQGTYEIYAGSPDDSVVLHPQVAIFGGFSGQETSRDQRDARAHPTILDGQGQIHHVIRTSWGGLLDGFTIQGGRASGAPPADRGGGLLVEGGEMTVTGCFFRNNQASTEGGGIFHHGSHLTVQNCSFVDNAAEGGSGGALSTRSGTLSVVSSVFLRNRAKTLGGAIHSGGLDCRIHHGTLTQNAVELSQSPMPTGKGGALAHTTSAPLAVINSIIYGNTSQEIELSAPAVVSLTNSSLPVPPGVPGPASQSDPAFVDPANGDLHLRTGSPCIDAAAGQYTTVTDLEGKPRKDDPDTVNTGSGAPPFGDLGALEYQP